MKFGTRLYLAVVTAMALVACALGLTAPPAFAATGMDTELQQGSVVTVSTQVQQDFSEWLVKYTGVVDWNQVNGVAGSTTNTARMNELKAVTPLAMVEGTARDLIQYLGSTAYTGPFQLGGMDRGACLVGELTGGFLKKWQIESMVDNQAVRNSLQYLVYTQYDNPQATIAQAQEQLGKMSDWPLGVGSFERGLTANLKGIDACYLSARAT